MKISHQSPDAKQRKAAFKDRQVSSGFKHMIRGIEHEFQSDLLSRTNVTGRASKITAKRSLGQLVPDFEWRSTANDQVLFAADEFLEMAIAMDEFVEEQIKKGW